MFGLVFDDDNHLSTLGYSRTKVCALIQVKLARSIQVTLLLSTTLTAALGVARGQRVAAVAKDRNVNDEKAS